VIDHISNLKKHIAFIAASIILIMPLYCLAEETAEEEENIGWVTEISGSATITKPSTGERLAMAEGTEVFQGDEIETSPDANVTIQFEDDSIVTVAGGSKMEVSSFVYDKEQSRNASYFKLFYGRMRGLLNSLFSDNSEMSIETENSVAGVRGSDISVWIENGETVAAVTEGHGFIKHRDKRFAKLVKLRAGQMMRARRAMALGRPDMIPDRVKEHIRKLPVRKKAKLMKKLRENKRIKLKKRMELRKKMLKNNAVKRKVLKNKLREKRREHRLP